MPTAEMLLCMLLESLQQRHSDMLEQSTSITHWKRMLCVFLSFWVVCLYLLCEQVALIPLTIVGTARKLCGNCAQADTTILSAGVWKFHTHLIQYQHLDISTRSQRKVHLFTLHTFSTLGKSLGGTWAVWHDVCVVAESVTIVMRESMHKCEPRAYHGCRTQVCPDMTLAVTNSSFWQRINLHQEVRSTSSCCGGATPFEELRWSFMQPANSSLLFSFIPQV